MAQSSSSSGKKVIRIDVSSDSVCPWCFVGKRNLDKAITESKDQFDFEVSQHCTKISPWLIMHIVLIYIVLCRLNGIHFFLILQLLKKESIRENTMRRSSGHELKEFFLGWLRSYYDSLKFLLLWIAANCLTHCAHSL